MILKINGKQLQVKKAITFKQKLFGFVGKTNFNYSLLFRCNGIHTFFMKEEIDVILTDKNYKVLFLYKNFGKNKIIPPKKGVYYTIELPTNTIDNLAIGDILNIKEKE